MVKQVRQEEANLFVSAVKSWMNDIYNNCEPVKLNLQTSDEYEVLHLYHKTLQKYVGNCLKVNNRIVAYLIIDEYADIDTATCYVNYVGGIHALEVRKYLRDMRLKFDKLIVNYAYITYEGCVQVTYLNHQTIEMVTV